MYIQHIPPPAISSQFYYSLRFFISLNILFQTFWRLAPFSIVIIIPSLTLRGRVDHHLLTQRTQRWQQGTKRNVLRRQDIKGDQQRITSVGDRPSSTEDGENLTPNSYDTTQSRTQDSSCIPQSISIRIQLSLYSQVSVLQDTSQSGTQGSLEYHSLYQSGYDSVCILRYLSYKMQLNVIPNLYLSFKKVIQDASCFLTQK